MKRTRHLGALVALIVSLSAGPSVHAQVPTLPNLVPLAPYGIYIGATDRLEGQPPPSYPVALRFSTTIANRGSYPLDVLADPKDPTNLDDQNAVANQCTLWVARACTERQAVGTFGWNTSHQHFHVDALVKYELRRLNEAQSPDMSQAGLVAGGAKVTFCMEDTDFDASWQLGPTSTPVYEYCTGVLQGISSGFYDEYPSGLTGQQLSLEGVADGDYAIVITLNPDGRFFETTRADDVSWRGIRLLDGGNTVMVL